MLLGFRIFKDNDLGHPYSFNCQHISDISGENKKKIQRLHDQPRTLEDNLCFDRWNFKRQKSKKSPQHTPSVGKGI